jgi:hypothetical protein
MKRLSLAGALLLAMLVPASAVAAPHHPTGEFANFGDCPLSNPTVAYCLYSETYGGTFQLGKKTSPVEKPVYLQGGFTELGETAEISLIGAEDGNTLSKTPQWVPGGLAGIPAPESWPLVLKALYNSMINNGLTGVSATLELAGPPSSVHINLLNSILQEGTALSMPVKIKLGNVFLGSSCYIGSNSNPIQLNLTTGTTSPPPPNEPISGSAGNIGENVQATRLFVTEGRFVDNSFAVPGANGCGGLFSFLVDPFVNSVVGVPSAAGNNAAILENNLEIAQRGAVEASE